MPTKNIAAEWAKSLGLIDVPLFHHSGEEGAYHKVLLDGGWGSFALSSSQHSEVLLDEVANWVWSAHLPHHVHVTDHHVTLSRWDDPASVRRFSKQSVEGKLETFYEFLVLDRVKSRFDVVEHSIDMLRRIRSHISERKLRDDSSLQVFLFMIASMLSSQDVEAETNPESLLRSYALDPDYVDAFASLGDTTLSALIEQFISPSATPRALTLVPQLLIRHASGTVFQEAHFELIRSSPLDLFGLPGAAEVRITTRGGIHFTPPGLARAVVEQALAGTQLGSSIIVLDPACGAGAFLHEVLRFLNRIEYDGDVTLIGYDSSPNAVAMARFALNEASKDWPQGRIETIEIENRNSLNPEDQWPRADYIFMNPPFMAWENLETSQREDVRQILGRYHAGRPDYSVAFIEKALTSVKNGGIVGTLLPSSVLSVESSLKWRHHVLDEATIKFLSVLGEHGLFRHAIVEVAAAVFQKGTSGDDPKFLSLWSSQKRGASGEALRILRKESQSGDTDGGLRPPRNEKSDEWRVSIVSCQTLREIPDWRPRPNRLREVLPEVRRTVGTDVGDIFHIQQGIRAGLRKAFIVKAKDYNAFPKSERKFFRGVAENKNIKEGRITAHDFIFYPDTPSLPKIESEDELKSLLPFYYERYLKPYREELIARKGLGSRDWWTLTRPRAYFDEPQIKLVTAYFGDAGSFALDLIGDYVVVQGFAWFVRPRLRQQIAEGILYAYLALLNSDLFALMLAEFCPHVAGGQFNLSKRFVDQIPFPNLAKEERLNPDLGQAVIELADQGKAIHLGQSNDPLRINELVALVYNVSLHLWQPKTK